MSDTIKAVLTGCGGIAGGWMANIKLMDDIEMVGLVDINLDAVKKRQEDWELPDVAIGTDLDEMLAEIKPDVVFDCTIPEAHHPVTLTALKHGCHVLGEKPLADSMEHAHEMVKAAKESGKIYAVIQNRRYAKNIRSLRRFLDNGNGPLGKITTVNQDFYLGAHFDGFRAEMDHVLLLDMAIHSFDQARLISGVDPKSVYCHEWNPQGSWYNHGGSAMAIFEMTEDIVLNYRGSWCSEGLNTSWQCNWHIVCEHGSAEWDGEGHLKAEIVDSDDGFFRQMKELEIPIIEDEKDGAHGGVIREFIDCVKSGATPETICTDNIKSLAMVFAAIESAETGQKVAISV